MFIKAQNNNRAIAFTKLTFSPIVFMIYRRSLAFSIICIYPKKLQFAAYGQFVLVLIKKLNALKMLNLTLYKNNKII